MTSGILSSPGAALGTYERRIGQQFQSLAASLIKATPTERESKLKELASNNPGMANRLRQFLDRSEDARNGFTTELAKRSEADRDTLLAWPRSMAGALPLDTLPGMLPASPSIPPHRNILFAPEDVPVMGTTPPAPGMVTAFGVAGATLPGSAMARSIGAAGTLRARSQAYQSAVAAYRAQFGD